MLRYTCCAAFAALFCSIASAQQPAGPGEVVRQRKTEAPVGVRLVGCVMPETKPNAFRLVLAPATSSSGAVKMPKGLRPGSIVELVARGETNLQPLSNQKVEVTGKLTNRNRQLEVVDARPIGACDATPSQP
jgi:hypothetical protein